MNWEKIAKHITLENVVKGASILASVIAVVNGIDTYAHNHPNGWNNHNTKI